MSVANYKTGWMAWVDDAIKRQRRWQKAQVHWAFRENDRVLRMFCWECLKLEVLINSAATIPSVTNGAVRRTVFRAFEPIFDKHLHAPKRGRPRKVKAVPVKSKPVQAYVSTIPKAYLDL